MGQKANVLDALAWAGVSESARVARIAAKLVRELHQYKDEHTKTRIKDAVKATSPPYGRGKYIIAAVDAEYQRQLPIYKERKEQFRQDREDRKRRPAAWGFPGPRTSAVTEPASGTAESR